MAKKIILTKILNDCYIDGKKANYKEFDKFFNDLINYFNSSGFYIKDLTFSNIGLAIGV